MKGYAKHGKGKAQKCAPPKSKGRAMQSSDTHWNCMEKKNMEAKSNGAAGNGRALSSNGEETHCIAMVKHG